MRTSNSKRVLLFLSPQNPLPLTLGCSFCLTVVVVVLTVVGVVVVVGTVVAVVVGTVVGGGYDAVPFGALDAYASQALAMSPSATSMLTTPAFPLRRIRAPMAVLPRSRARCTVHPGGLTFPPARGIHTPAVGLR